MLLSSALAAGLQLEVHSGLLEERDLFRDGMATREVVKGTPDGEMLTIVVRVPEAWLVAPEDLSPAEARDQGQVDEMLRATKQLPARSAYEEAARFAAIFRNGSFEQSRPRERYAGVLMLWEVLWEHQSADTLSASLATLSLMGERDIAGSLARYLCSDSDTGRAFGVLVPGESEEGVSWSYPAGEGALLTLHPNARPDGDEVLSDELEVWTLDEALDVAWDPLRPGASKPPPRQKKRAPPTAEEVRNLSYYALSAGVGAGALVLVGLFSWRTRTSRQRALDARRQRERERF